jgi:hypothetical protein
VATEPTILPLDELPATDPTQMVLTDINEDDPTTQPTPDINVITNSQTNDENDLAVIDTGAEFNVFVDETWLPHSYPIAVNANVRGLANHALTVTLDTPFRTSYVRKETTTYSTYYW